MSSPNLIFRLAVLAISLLALGLGTFFLVKTFALPSVGLPTQSISQNALNFEFLPSQSDQSIFVEVSGAVKFPSVYKLPLGSRVVDFLKKAGGLTEAADKAWVEKNINQAAKVGDGAKLYFPHLGENLAQPATAVVDTSMPTPAPTKINVNTATAGELESLPGIAAKRSEAIVAGRPYGKIEDLLERKIIPANVFETIKDKISVQ